MVFHTQDQNLVKFIDFTILLVDLNYAKNEGGYRRTYFL